MDRQVCVIKTLAYRARTDRHTHGQTKVKKTEGPKILSNYIFYFKNVIIGGPTVHKYIIHFSYVNLQHHEQRQVQVLFILGN